MLFNYLCKYKNNFVSDYNNENEYELFTCSFKKQKIKKNFKLLFE